MEILNNREIAILIWGIVFLGWCLMQRSLRESFGTLMETLFGKAILRPLTLMVLYISLLVYLLSKIGLWEVQQLKNTIIWSVSVAAVSFFRINSISKDPHYFKNSVKDNLKLIVFLEFVVAFYTFNIVIELIIVPITIIIGAFLAVGQLDKKYKIVENTANNLLSIFGLVVVSYAGYKLISDTGAFARKETLVDFYIPLLLSVLYLPFIYFLMVFMRYEMAFY